MIKFKDYYLLNEKMGVIENAHEESEKIYNIMMEMLETVPYDYVLRGITTLYDNDKDAKIEILKTDPDYETILSNIPFKGLNFHISFEYYDLNKMLENGLLLGMATPIQGKKWDEKTNRYFVEKTKTVDLVIKIGLDPSTLRQVWVNTLFDDPEKFNGLFKNVVINNIQKEKIIYISAISHELSHIFTGKKIEDRGYKLKSHVNYVSNLGTIPMIPIRKVAELFYNMYFMHIMETHNLPTQVHSKMKQENIEKGNFLSFIQNQEEYKKLKKIKDYSYDQFIQDLKSEIQNMDGILRDLNIPEEVIKATPDDKKIKEILDISYLSFTKMLEQTTLPIITPRLYQIALMSGPDKTEEIMNKIKREMIPYGNNHVLFFKKKIDSMSKEANVQIKRLMKIYDYAK